MKVNFIKMYIYNRMSNNFQAILLKKLVYFALFMNKLSSTNIKIFNRLLSILIGLYACSKVIILNKIFHKLFHFYI